MILIADSGSTKAHWRLIDDLRNIHSFSTQGLNPYFQTADEISTILNTELVPEISFKIRDLDVFFYGAGCGIDEKNKVIVNGIKNSFNVDRIEVNNDLLAAARALCGYTNGIAAISGTGSNTCLYDGKKIIEQAGGLGYIIGDEGSGSHIGKLFIQAYFNNDLPIDIARLFEQTFKLSKEQLLDAIYKKTLPNRFLASFSKFVNQNIAAPVLKKMVAYSFEQFIEKYICKYQNYSDYEFNCVGSVGYSYSNILKEVCDSRNVKVGKIIQSPIDTLTQYHLETI